ncbi:MAG: GNAT family N-acetyltransferase [Spirochaetaceae bacterium]|jgi:RimJ/RimL family protein N-acetyltransferase|nr:GNAT family N-acetyltransferase [Spirochaetaceae bacterium]
MSGNKCYLSPINVNDAEKFAEWLNDLEVTVNLTLYNNVINTENEKALLENLSKEHHYSIIDQETNALLGSCGFVDIDHLNQTAEVGICIGNKQYWNRGYGTEALILLLDYGFKALNLHNVLIRVYAFNERAAKCYEKAGFKLMGKRRDTLRRGKKKYDVTYLDILYDEFYETNAARIESFNRAVMQGERTM